MGEEPDYSVAAESAILVALPELHELTDRWCSACLVPSDPPRPLAEVVPPHLTVLVPWAPQPDADMVASLRELAASHPPFELRFGSVSVWENELVVLEPESGQLDRLLAAVWQAFPDYPPYEGRFEKVHTHLTVSTQGGESVAAEVRATLAERGDVVVTVDEISAWQRGSSGVWEQVEAFPLGGATPR